MKFGITRLIGSVFWTFFLIIVPDIVTQAADSEVYPTGDPRRCAGIKGNRTGRFEVIPGSGWDNLRNKEMGMVIGLSYMECKTTEDGMFLIPDGVRAIPVKNSKVDSYAELIEHWDDYSSILSRSINAEAGLHTDNIGISGKFSDEYEDVKSKQHNDKTVTTRVQARYIQYNAKMEPDTAVNKVFQSRLRKIAAHLTLNRTDLARYESQLLVRDFGTHVINSIDAGAALVQVDELSAQYMESKETQKQDVLASATASFFGILNFDAGYSKSSQQTDVDGYRQKRTSSKIMTFGGPLFRPMNFTADNWTESIQTDLVALDRSGEPIYNFINDVTLPSVHRSIIYDVYEKVKDAVHLYYEHNTRRGCTNANSTNFNFQANLDDGTCNKTTESFTFGGVYQICKATGYADLCEGRNQTNVFTNAYTCPQNYEAVLLQKNTQLVSRSRQKCNRCWKYFHCCHWTTEEARADYAAYWCAGIGLKDAFKGFLFGGLYTTSSVNSFTQAKTCPLYYYSIKLFTDLTVCITDNYELGTQHALPFGGFFSCITGNPFTDVKRARFGLQNSNKTDLESYMLDQGVQEYMHFCPEGYSQHLATVDVECKIYYCVKSGAMAGKGLPKIQRPPFMNAPKDGYSDILDTDFVVNSNGELWTIKQRANKEVPTFLAQQGLDYQPVTNSPTLKRNVNQPNQRPNTLSDAGIAAISALATIISVLVGSGIVVSIRRSLNRRY
ncbi:macrophage-expressed gene 1 protein-like [Mercenaria mercenaria]|uniref:macrophage-expressed gene 1 protein-like n=1 Tax=Mercenaria mercenaria TaxID=6596 RepID=UPI00234FAB9F|nr:macrophage-expressed gene 1 protein-like [Mercenaria mercenaria]